MESVKNRTTNQQILDLLQKPIEEFNPSNRTCNGIKSTGVRDFGDLISKEIIEYRTVAGIGSKTINEINHIVETVNQKYGTSFEFGIDVSELKIEIKFSDKSEKEILINLLKKVNRIDYRLTAIEEKLGNEEALNSLIDFMK